MRLIPVLDLRGGRAVHARGGDRSSYAPVRSRLAPRAHAGDAPAIAASYAAAGARCIYVADLEAIEGRPRQESLVRACATSAGTAGGAALWIDAGIATPQEAQRWSRVPGVERLVVGLETVGRPDALADIVCAAHPMAVMFSVDLRDGVPVTRDEATRRMSAPYLAAAAVLAGAASVLVLDLARVGSGAGVDERMARDVAARIAPVELVVGGGIQDLDAARRLWTLGVHGVLVASALHDGRIDGRALAKHGVSA